MHSFAAGRRPGRMNAWIPGTPRPARVGAAAVRAERGLLFLDELTTAPPAVQAAMLRVVLERVVGDVTLPPAVRVVAAANPPRAGRRTAGNRPRRWRTASS